MSLATDSADGWVSYCLSYQDLIIHDGARPGLLAALRKDWRALLRSPSYFAETKAAGIAAILKRLPADTSEADANYYGKAAERLSLTLGELLYNSTTFNQIADKTFLALQVVSAESLGAYLHGQIMRWRDSEEIKRYSVDANGFENDVGLLFSYLISFLRDLSVAIKENFKREKNVKQLEELGLPTDTRQLEQFIEKAISSKELGELFSWKKAKAHSFKTWMDEWFRGEDYFVYFVLNYLSKLDPEFKVKGPAVRYEKSPAYYTKGRKASAFNTTGLHAGGNVNIDVAAAFNTIQWGGPPAAVAAPAMAVNPMHVAVDEFLDNLENDEDLD